MRANQFLRLCLIPLLAGTVTAAIGQPRPCSAVAPNEREVARASGACRDSAPIVEPALKQVEPAPVVTPVPGVVGLAFDDARDRLAGFSVRRSYRASVEPGGTVLEQQPAPPSRVAAGAIIRVVLSDGTLRPAPSVAASEIDQPPAPFVTTRDVVPQPDAASGIGAAVEAIEPRPAGEARSANVTQSNVESNVATERVRAPRVVGMPIREAQTRLAQFRIERIDRPSNAPVGQVIAQAPKAFERIARDQPISLIVSSGPANSAAKTEKAEVRAPRPAPTESFELPNVVGRSDSDASNALAEFKVERVEVAHTAPRGEVLAQDPSAGTSMPAGTTVRLQVSDASLASPPITTPVAAPEPAPVPAPFQAPVQTRVPITFESNAALGLGAGIALGLLIGALLARRWLLNRRPEIDELSAEPTRLVPVNAASSSVAVAETPPVIRFAARLDEGETTIEFTASSDPDEDPDTDEMTVEQSGDIHA